jgi:hypothetical protein
MNEQMRKKMINTQNISANLSHEKEEKLEDIKAVVQIYKESPIIQELKKLGNEYKELERKEIEAQEQYKYQKNLLSTYCTHPILAIISYKKRNNNNRIISVSKENATYIQVRCLECGKYTYTKDKDDTEDWYNYIILPSSLVGIEKANYVKRKVIELPKDTNYDKIHNYYESIMFEQPEEQTVQKVLKKIKKNDE